MVIMPAFQCFDAAAAWATGWVSGLQHFQKLNLGTPTTKKLQ